MRWQMVVLLAGSVLVAPLQGQRMGGGGMRGTGMSAGGFAFGSRPGFSGGRFSRNLGFRHFQNFGGFGAFWIPWYYPWDYWDLPSFRDDWYGSRGRDLPQSDESFDGQAQNSSTAPVIIVRSDQPAPTRPPEPSKVIDIPIDKESSPSSTQVPTLFVLANGTRLEASRYMLSANSLQIDLDDKRRTIPIRELDLKQTIAANRERGIELKVPRSASEVFLGF